MKSPLYGLLALSIMAATTSAQVISSMDEMRFTAPKENGQVELVEGKQGKAVKFDFAKDSRSTFATSNLRGTPDWDKAEGFSFWVKGIGGSNQFAGLEFIWNEDYGLRYDYCFPARGTDWTKVTVAWQDLVPVLPRPNAHLLDPRGDNRPSKLGGLWFGRWWYWADYPALNFVIDDAHLEPRIPRDTNSYVPSGPPMERTLAKLQAGKPITIVTMGDSLTDFRHWANRQIAWPNLLRDALAGKYKSSVTIVNPAIGGTLLRQNLVLMPRWLEQAPEPDLVTMCFGANDWESGMRGELFRESWLDAIDRVRRATGGHADVLVMTTIPSVKDWETRAELGDACRAAAAAKNAGLADTEKAFWTAGKENHASLFAWDKVHLSPTGHTNVAETAIAAIERQGR